MAIVYKDNIKIKNINTSQFESGVWRLEINNCSILAMIIYPPAQNCRSITAFSDKFLDLYTTTASFGKNIFIAVYFNIHVDDKNDLDSKQFRDLSEVMGLDQHVYFPMHVSGHTLDLILSENGSSLNIQ